MNIAVLILLLSFSIYHGKARLALYTKSSNVRNFLLVIGTVDNITEIISLNTAVFFVVGDLCSSVKRRKQKLFAMKRLKQNTNLLVVCSKNNFS